ncbi:MAG TPA: tetratricopeptide repeat protein, partial [Bacteroidales bacterium]
MYDTLTKWKNNPSTQAKLYYNLGNSYIKEKKLEEGISAYKNSLKNDPKDEDTKYNLAYARKLLKKQQQDQKNKDKNKDNKHNKDKDKNKQDQNKDNKDKKDNKDQQKQNNQDNKDNKDNKNSKQKQGEQPQISPEAAQQMLDAIQNDEKAVLKRLQEQKNQGQKVPVSKNW